MNELGNILSSVRTGDLAIQELPRFLAWFLLRPIGLGHLVIARPK